MATRFEGFAAGPRCWWALAGLLVLTVLSFQIGPYKELAGLEGAVLFDEQPVFSTQEAARNLSNLGEGGVALYREFLLVDLVAGPASMLMMALLLARALPRWRPEQTGRRLLLILPAVAALLDWGENAGIAWMLAREPSQLGALPGLVGTITMGKFMFAGLGAVATCWVWLSLGYRRFRQRRS